MGQDGEEVQNVITDSDSISGPSLDLRKEDGDSQSTLTDSSTPHCLFQDKIHALSLLSFTQPKLLPTTSPGPRLKGEGIYVHQLDMAATLIAMKSSNGQAAATTWFRSPERIRIVWALGGNEAGSTSHLAVERYVEGLRNHLFDHNDLQEAVRYIVHECRPTILRHFQAILRCIARDSLCPTPPKVQRSAKARTWRQEIQFLLNETQKFLAKGFSMSAVAGEHTTSYEEFVHRISTVGEATTCGDLADMVVYAFFLTTTFGKSAPLSLNLWKLLKEAGKCLGLTIGLRRFLVLMRKKHQNITVEFERVCTSFFITLEPKFNVIYSDAVSAHTVHIRQGIECPACQLKLTD
ncbi:MAG: hypothetical protein Q9213_006110 [Squamulea squamosa]